MSYKIKAKGYMRILTGTACLLLLVGCMTAPSLEPHEYLDEQTAATITKVGAPWIFNREGVPAQLDFVHLYAIDVNRVGTHRKYLVVVKHWPSLDSPGNSAPMLQLRAQGVEVALEPASEEGRDLGVAQPLDPTAPKGAKSWFYPIETADLESISRSPDLKVALVHKNVRAPYVVWRDGRAALSEFSAVARDL